MWLFNEMFKSKRWDYDIYIEARFNVLNNVKNIESKIITSEDFILPFIGVKKKLNKRSQIII